MKRFSNLARIFVIVAVVVIVFSCTLYKIQTGKVSNDATLQEFVVEKGQTFSTIGSQLKTQNLIKSEFFYKLYIKLFQESGLEAGSYQLSENMGVEKIVERLKKGSTKNPDAVTITFQEGLNMRQIASIIAENTNHTEEEVYAVLEDTTYLDRLISNYWFLTDEIKNSKIYYALEGYLFPDTYEFLNKDVGIETIFETMLDHMEQKLKPLQAKIEASNYSVHELLTLASIVELEAPAPKERARVAGVFYNRLQNNWSLGSDITTYYAVKVNVGERDLYQSEINAYNAYNTRNAKMAGKLPVSPVCNPSLESIESAIEPENHTYYYFVADKNKKVYFTKTEAEHSKLVQSLKDQGLWYQF